jgi:hypothetical protein
MGVLEVFLQDVIDVAQIVDLIILIRQNVDVVIKRVLAFALPHRLRQKLEEFVLVRWSFFSVLIWVLFRHLIILLYTLKQHTSMDFLKCYLFYPENTEELYLFFNQIIILVYCVYVLEKDIGNYMNK